MVFRELDTRCVACGTPLGLTRTLGHSFWTCPGCRAIWIEEPMLRCMFSDMAAVYPPRYRPREVARARPCPTCREPMTGVTLHDVPIERCERHGIWFENHELEEVLRRAATAR